MEFRFSLAACDQDHSLAQGPNVGGGGSAQMRLHRLLPVRCKNGGLLVSVEAVASHDKMFLVALFASV